jgi:C-terminal processing protease CtpA/Prc
MASGSIHWISEILLLCSSALAQVNLDAGDRQRVIDAVISNLKEHYVDTDGAQKIADRLRAQDYAQVTDGAAFASLLTRQLRDAGHDPQLEIFYSQAPAPERSAAPSSDSVARYRKAMEDDNCAFKKVEILPHNIGYLKLNWFPELSICKSVATAAMTSLNHADAIIFDLRDNRGGFPDMVMLIAAYLFDHPEYMYNPRENTTARSWTRSPVPGSELADKPVYILTSARTISGAEHFSYDLKMLKRATVVGETTGGAAHSGVFHRIDSHFGIVIRETSPINPFSQGDWEGTGVEPDVKVKASDALEAAKQLARRKLQKKGSVGNQPH